MFDGHFYVLRIQDTSKHNVISIQIFYFIIRRVVDQTAIQLRIIFLSVS